MLCSRYLFITYIYILRTTLTGNRKKLQSFSSHLGKANCIFCFIFSGWLKVGSIITSYRWSLFLPVTTNSSMLSILLLLSKYRLRNVPVIEPGKPDIQNFITQSAIVQGLEGCKGRDWFDCIAAQPISNVGLPFVSANEVHVLLISFLVADFSIWTSSSVLFCFLARLLVSRVVN